MWHVQGKMRGVSDRVETNKSERHLGLGTSGAWDIKP